MLASTRWKPALFGLILLLPAACFGRSAPAPPAPGGEARGVSLAHVSVHNETGSPLEIAYRWVSETARDVVVGSVEPGATVRVAPVPAGEPIVLVARTETGSFLVLPARSFEPDEAWLWVIPRDARFRGGWDAS